MASFNNGMVSNVLVALVYIIQIMGIKEIAPLKRPFISLNLSAFIEILTLTLLMVIIILSCVLYTVVYRKNTTCELLSLATSISIEFKRFTTLLFI